MARRLRSMQSRFMAQPGPEKRISPASTSQPIPGRPGNRSNSATIRHTTPGVCGAIAGEYVVMSRATDSQGRTQPQTAVWNPSGYLYNAIDQVKIHVQA